MTEICCNKSGKIPPSAGKTSVGISCLWYWLGVFWNFLCNGLWSIFCRRTGQPDQGWAGRSNEVRLRKIDNLNEHFLLLMRKKTVWSLFISVLCIPARDICNVIPITGHYSKIQTKKLSSQNKTLDKWLKIGQEKNICSITFSDLAQSRLKRSEI